MLGYINNKKGFSVSRNGTTDVAYILDHEYSNGYRIVIRAYNRTSGNTYDLANPITFWPIVPYRLRINDVDVINKAWNSSDKSLLTLFNPGLTWSGDTITGWQGDDQEINFTRNQVSWLDGCMSRGAKYTSMKTPSDYYIGTGSQFITVNDDAVSMAVSNKDASADYVILAVCSTIKLSFKHALSLNSSSSSFTTCVYTLPTVLVYEVPRTNTVSCTVSLTPKSWTYNLVSANEWISPTTWKLNPELAVSPDTYLPNFNFSSLSYSKQLPIDFGCIQDITFDGTDLYLAEEMGHVCYDDQQRLWMQVLKKANILVAVGFYTFSTADLLFFPNYFGFLKRADGSRLLNLATHASIDINGTILCVVYSKVDGPFIYFSDTTDPRNIYTVKTITDAKICTVDKYLDGFLLGFDTGGAYHFYYTGAKATVVSRVAASGDRLNNTMDNLKTLAGFSLLGSLTKPVQPKDNKKLLDMATEGSFLNRYDLITDLRKNVMPTSNDYVPKGITNSFGNGTLGASNNYAVFSYKDTEVFMVEYSSTGFNIRSPSNSRIINVGGKLVSDGNSNFPANTQCYLTYNNTNGIITNLQNIATGAIVIGSSGQFVYSLDETVTDNGIWAVFQINNCSGIYRLNTGTTGWESNLGGGEVGCPVDYDFTREDFKFEYDGNYDTFISSAGVNGYWARLKEPITEVTVTRTSTGANLLESDNGINYIQYSSTGACRIHIPVKLNLGSEADALGKVYADSGYSLSDVKVTVKINAPVPITKTFSNIIFRPPSSSIGITSAITKVFNNYIDYTATKTDTNSKIYNLCINEKTKTDANTVPRELTVFKDNINAAAISASTTYRVALQKCTKGDYFYLSWVENISDRSITTPNAGVKSYIKDHRYLISNPTLYIDDVDETDDVYNSSSPYLYLDPGGASVNLKVRFSLNHETFDEGDFNAGLVDTDRYPLVSQISLAAVPARTWPAVRTRMNKMVPLIYIFKKDPPVGAPVTYPNNTDQFATELLATTGAIITTSGYAATTELTGASITVPVTVSKQYQLFLIVKDEYSQYSVFHITSKNKEDNSKTYRTEFT